MLYAEYICIDVLFVSMMQVNKNALKISIYATVMVMSDDKSFECSSYENIKEYIIFVVSICQLNMYAFQIRNCVISDRQQKISYKLWILKEHEWWWAVIVLCYYTCYDGCTMHSLNLNIIYTQVDETSKEKQKNNYQKEMWCFPV